jgi:hypothetical protein
MAGDGNVHDLDLRRFRCNRRLCEELGFCEALVLRLPLDDSVDEYVEVSVLS